MRRSWRRVLLTFLAGGAVLVTAFGIAQRVTLTVSQRAIPEDYLADAYGRSLYVNLAESDGVSRCDVECAARWLPVLIRGETTVNKGADEGLVGRTVRSDGQEQLTYGGFPVYYFVDDARAGQYFGQAVEGEWFLISPTGEPLADVAGPPVAQAPVEDSDGQDGGTADVVATDSGGSIGTALIVAGGQNFAAICAACHGPDGLGASGPRLVGNAHLADTDYVLERILHGFGYMPAVGKDQSDGWVAAVATFVRNSWGNAYGPVSEEEVAAAR